MSTLLYIPVGRLIRFETSLGLLCGQVVGYSIGRLYVKRLYDYHIMELSNWGESYRRGRLHIIDQQPPEDLIRIEPCKTVVIVTDRRIGSPGWITRCHTWLSGRKWKKNRAIGEMSYMNCGYGDPGGVLLYGWQCKQKLKGTLYPDGFFLSFSHRYPQAIYFPQYDKLQKWTETNKVKLSC